MEPHEDEVARQRAIADACLRSAPPPPGRLKVYRALVQTNLAVVARRLLPRTARALDSTSVPFDAWVARFLDAAAPRTPFLRDVPLELVAWASPSWSNPSYVADLARYEVDCFRVESSPATSSAAAFDVRVDRPLVFAPARLLSRYMHAVHEDEEAPKASPTTLLIHRDAESTVHTTLLAPARAELLELLLRGLPLSAALERASGHGMDAPALASWLADLGATGALLGGAG